MLDRVSSDEGLIGGKQIPNEVCHPLAWGSLEGKGPQHSSLVTWGLFSALVSNLVEVKGVQGLGLGK